MNEIHYRYWTDEDKRALAEASHSLEDMLAIALDVTSRMPPGLHFVIGPISTGGIGDIATNLVVFRGVIEHLCDQGLNVFSQMPFEEGMISYHRQWERNRPAGEYCWPILHEFYEKLFEQREFAIFHLIHGYERSTGASWEHGQAVKRNIGRHYLPPALSESILQQARMQTAIRL